MSQLTSLGGEQRDPSEIVAVELVHLDEHNQDVKTTRASRAPLSLFLSSLLSSPLSNLLLRMIFSQSLVAFVAAFGLFVDAAPVWNPVATTSKGQISGAQGMSFLSGRPIETLTRR